MDDEWRAENLTKTTEPTTSPQVVLLFQGVTSIASAEGKPEEFIVTVVKQGGGEILAHCCHIAVPEQYHQCKLSPFVTVNATNHDRQQNEIQRVISRLHLVEGGVVVGPEETGGDCSIREIGSPHLETSQSSSSSASESTANAVSPPPLLRAPPNDQAGQSSELAEILSTGEVLVRVITWNHQAQPPPPPLVLREKLMPERFHVFVVGSEECENTIAKSVAFPSKAHWEGCLREALGSGYVMLCGHTLQATHSIVFVRRFLVPLVSNVRSHAVATGLAVMGSSTKLGNKGGIGIAFNIGDTSLLFINAHLAHAKDGLDKRNKEYTTITAQLSRALVGSRGGGGSSGGGGGGGGGGGDASGGGGGGAVEADIRNGDDDDNHAVRALMAHFDCVIWAGDLNYRLDTDRTTADMLLAAQDLEAALKFDQLRQVLFQSSNTTNDATPWKTNSNAACAFKGLIEAPITFPPTYKFDKDSDVYDTSKKQRVPSWTDRVLFKASSPSVLELSSYESAQTIRTSDHRPVHASFVLRPALKKSIGALTAASEESGAALPGIGQNTSQVCSMM